MTLNLVTNFVTAEGSEVLQELPGGLRERTATKFDSMPEAPIVREKMDGITQGYCSVFSGIEVSDSNLTELNAVRQRLENAAVREDLGFVFNVRRTDTGHYALFAGTGTVYQERLAKLTGKAIAAKNSGKKLTKLQKQLIENS